jgi:flagellar biosynthesis protein FlhF
MKLKSYFAATIETALSQAQLELGPEAMLVDSRRTGPDARHLGEYEVVCAILPPSPEAGTPPAAPSRPAAKGAGFDKLTQEVSDLKRYMEKMALTIARSSSSFSHLRSHPELAEGYACLTSSDVDQSVAHDIVTLVAERLEEGGQDVEIGNSAIGNMVVGEVERILSVDNRLGRPGSQQIVAALVGPPGAGKTTCLVKLAARFGLQTRKPTQILSLDTHRVGAAEQLRTYAAILGMGFQVVETVGALGQALEEYRHKDLILIDTPGFAANEMQDGADIARFFAGRNDIDTHLVLPASVKSSNLKRIAELYEVFRPGKLFFTRIDETATLGAVLNLAVATGKPISFLSAGQQIPEDLEPANRFTLARKIVQREYLESVLNQAVAAA